MHKKLGGRDMSREGVRTRDGDSDENLEEVAEEQKYVPPCMPEILKNDTSDCVTGDEPSDKLQKDKHIPKGKEVEKNEGAMFDKFEHFMREAAQIRSEAKSGMMTDEERRQRAGDTAFKLMDLIGALDDFDEDDSSCDDD